MNLQSALFVENIEDAIRELSLKKGLSILFNEKKLKKELIKFLKKSGKLEELKKIYRILKTLELNDYYFEREIKRKREVSEEIYKILPKMEILNQKIFGIIPKTKINFNSSEIYKIFSKLLEKYTFDEIQKELSYLEEYLEGDERVKIKFLKQEFEEMNNSNTKKILALLFLLLTGLSIGGYLYLIYENVYLPKKIEGELEIRRISQLKEVGLSEEEAEEFNKVFKIYASPLYNSTILEYARFYKENKEFSLKVFEEVKNFRSSIDFIKKINELSLDNKIALKFISEHKDIVLNGKFEYPLILYSKNSTLFNIIRENIKNDSFLKGENLFYDEYRLISLTSKLFLDLNFIEKVKVIYPNGTIGEHHLKRDTINAVGNYSIAVNLLGLPSYRKEILHKVFNATQIDSTFYNYIFRPVYIKDADGNVHEIKSRNPPLAFYFTIYHFAKFPQISNRTEIWVPVALKSVQNVRDLFESRHAWPTSDRALRIIERQFTYYLENEKDLVYPILNYYKQKELIKNEDDLIVSQLIFWKLPSFVADYESAVSKGLTSHYYIGLDAFEKFLDTMAKFKKIIDGAYPDYKIRTARFGYIDVRSGYYDFPQDMEVWGNSNIVRKFIGVSLTEYYDVFNTNPKFFLTLNSSNAFLLNNLSPELSDKLQFIIGYMRYKFGDEASNYRFYEAGLKAYGIPIQDAAYYYEHYTRQPGVVYDKNVKNVIVIDHATGTLFIILGIPDEILEGLKKYGDYVRIPGNGITIPILYMDAVEKDIKKGIEYPYAPNLRGTWVELCFFSPKEGDDRIFVFKAGKVD